MTRILFSGLLVVSAAYLTGCASSDADRRERSGANRFGYGATEEVVQESAPVTPEPTAPVTAPEPEPAVQPQSPPPPSQVQPKTAAVTAPAKKDYQYGTAVPGKPGYVTSPHAPYSGYVDVRGFPPGTEVKDPYTGKIFLVP